MTTILTISLSKLIASPLNVRKTGGGVDDLAASIAAHGLIQSLTVRPAAGDKFEVIAGGRRLAAMQRLAKEKRLAKHFPVSCRVLDAEDATEISLAENQLRQAMHPADQFDAFKALSDGGMPNADIAARFGAAERTVEQRLKLARVSPALLAAYRADEMTLDQLMAFAVTDDHARQEAVWHMVAATYDRSAYAIRRHLTESKVAGRDRRARFIGQEAFTAAGGTVTRDLFSDEDECFFEEAALLDRLVSERLASEAATLGAEGWAWVDVASERLEHGLYRAYPLTVRDFTDAEQAEIDRLTEEADEIALRDTGSDEDEAAYLALHQQLDALDNARRSYPDDLKAQAGAVVHLAADGTLAVERGQLRREDAGKASDLAEELAPTKPKPELSAALLEELTAHRTQAMQAVLATNHRTALDALTHALAFASFYHRASSSCLQITAQRFFPCMRSEALAETPAAKALGGMRKGWTDVLPEQPADLWGWLHTAPEPRKDALLSFLIAETLNVVQQRGEQPKDTAAKLHAALDLDMADYWTCDAESYLSRVSAAKVLEAVREGVSPETADSLTGMKKGEMVKKAERKLAESRWLPQALRLPVTPANADEPGEQAEAA